MSYLVNTVNSTEPTNQNVDVNLTDLITGSPADTNILGYTGGNYAPLALSGLAHDYGDALFNWGSTARYSTGAIAYSTGELLAFYSSGLLNYDQLVLSTAADSIGAYAGWYMGNKQSSSVGKTVLLESVHSCETLSGGSISIQWHAGSSAASLSPIGPLTYCDEQSAAVAYGIYTIPDATNSMFALKVMAVSGTVRVMHYNTFWCTSYNVRDVT